MPNRSPIRALLRPALLLPLLSVACDPPPPPSTPDLPQVRVLLDEPSTVGTSLKFSISTSGCDQVQRLDLFDDTTPLKQVPFAGNPTPVELAMNEVPYTRGIAANLALSARVTCADGRTNISQAQLATFFPVAESISPLTATDQVVTDFFVAEGSGSTVSFIGCVRETTGQGLYKVTKNPADTGKRMDMPIPCKETTVITERRPSGTGWRWVWTPNEGLFAIDPQFKPGPVFRLKVDRLAVTPEGDALVYDKGEGAEPINIKRVTPAGEIKWVLNMGSFIIGDMVFAGSGPTVVIPLGNEFEDNTFGGKISVGTLNYDTAQWTSITLIHAPTNYIEWDYAPPVALNTFGTQLYIVTQNGASADVRACAVSGTGDGRCDPPTNQKWLRNLQGQMVALVPYANGSRLAAIAAHQTWFLDAATGQVVNKEAKSISPTGALVPRQVLLGPGSEFYLFTSAVLQQGQTRLPDPVEIIATEKAENGELYRYQIPGGSIAGSTDDSGALWLRVGRKLVRPLPLEQYRLVR
ncbi:MAG TPA: hypothetical protein VF794_27360 [Archangium sp.]|jgi:hypothetical protein|uniref:hypothetical protein n=1 Tax=Archangium sp. TaxID=1872627 RepID=UPI002EDB207A